MRSISIAVAMVAAVGCSSSEGADNGEQPMGVGEPQPPAFVEEALSSLVGLEAHADPFYRVAVVHFAWLCDAMLNDNGNNDRPIWYVWWDYSGEVPCHVPPSEYPFEAVDKLALAIQKSEATLEQLHRADEATTELEYACTFAGTGILTTGWERMGLCE